MVAARWRLRMSRYLELLRALRTGAKPHREAGGQDLSVSRCQDDESPVVLPLTDGRARRLEAAGWKHKWRSGLTIWERPDTGFWISQEMALHLLDAKNIRNNSGAKTRR